MRRGIIAILFVLAVPAAHAQVEGPVPLTGVVRTVSAGAGAQTDPHLSGSRLSYTARVTGSTVHVFDVLTGEDTPLEPGSAFQDSISDIAGNFVVFTRRETSTSTQTIAFVDLADPALTVRPLAPDGPTVRRTSAAIGADTVAFQQFTTTSNSVSAVCVASLSNPDDPAQCLTGEAESNSDPAVSPDGNTVVFQKCVSPDTACDVYAARRGSGGAWSAAVAITSGGGNDLSPATNGSVVVYASDAAGDFDVYHAPVDATEPATRLELTDAPGSDEQNPNISGTLISMERRLPGGTNADLYLFDLATGTLARLPATPDIDESLNDISTDVDGTVHVAYAAVDPLAPADGDNVYVFSFNPRRPSYLVCPLFDASRSFKAGRVAPLRIQLCDAARTNLSSPALVLTAIGLVQRDATASLALAAESVGSANEDGIFRYDAGLGGYIFNLSTHGLASGTWELQFRVSGDPAVYAIRFDVR